MSGLRADAEAYVSCEKAAMRAQMQSCSRGVRACIGKTLVLMQMKLATSALAQRVVTLRLAGNGDGWQTTADIRVTDRFVLVPKRKRCQLVYN